MKIKTNPFLYTTPTPPSGAGRLFFLLVLWLSACVREKVYEPQKFGYDYFPVGVGKSWTYQVTDSLFSLNTPRLTVKKFQVQDSLTEKYLDLDNDTTYRLERKSRLNDASPWQLDSIWTVKLLTNASRQSVNRLVLTQNNVALVKLVFPVGESVGWNALQLSANDSPDTILRQNIPYRMVSVGKPYSNFPKTLTVIQKKDSLIDLTKQEKYVEIYASGTGLVFKEDVYVEFCQNVNCGATNITFGRKRRQVFLR
jgi:hypothetical protein